jgi:hypothetical protein
MGRLLDLFSEVASEAEEGPEGLVLSPDTWDRLRADWSDEDIEDMLGLVHESLLQGELVEAADSLSARLVEVLGTFGEREAFGRAREGGAKITIEVIDHLARRVDRLEEILQVYREGKAIDRRGFDALRRRLANLGIEEDMKRGALPGQDDEDDD